MHNKLHHSKNEEVKFEKTRDYLGTLKARLSNIIISKIDEDSEELLVKFYSQETVDKALEVAIKKHSEKSKDNKITSLEYYNKMYKII
jgi:hypothetical protein